MDENIDEVISKISNINKNASPTIIVRFMKEISKSKRYDKKGYFALVKGLKTLREIVDSGHPESAKLLFKAEYIMREFNSKYKQTKYHYLKEKLNRMKKR